ncbi:hypothetical protein BRADI_1g26046v3 [Brachypodium distachyon]|uniref:Uncharacterized protein n=1 Tax=Brachypodium distachyon TaxID=15368 RepID=A0A2K2DL37_BRADI|nr:hypothetical protein BRADI_1g26046v3 [Brachypodium distachyon]
MDTLSRGITRNQVIATSPFHLPLTVAKYLQGLPSSRMIPGRILLQMCLQFLFSFTSVAWLKDLTFLLMLLGSPQLQMCLQMCLFLQVQRVKQALASLCIGLENKNILFLWRLPHLQVQHLKRRLKLWS